MSNFNTYTDTKTGAIECLTNEASSKLVLAAEQAVQAGTHAWTADPEAAGVWGLARVSSGAVDVIVYCDEADFEVSDEFAGSLR